MARKCGKMSKVNPNTNGSMSKVKATNADRIRSMSDEELADKMSGFGCCVCPLCFPLCNEVGTSCKDAILKWLKKAVEDV